MQSMGQRRAGLAGVTARARSTGTCPRRTWRAVLVAIKTITDCVAVCRNFNQYRPAAGTSDVGQPEIDGFAPPGGGGNRIDLMAL